MSNAVNVDSLEWLREASPDGAAQRFRKKLAAATGGPPQALTLRKFVSLSGEVDDWEGE